MKNKHATFAEENPDVPYDEQCKQLKYRIYVRKSTEDANRQVRSIEDQIVDCRALADKLGLTVVGEPIRERQSAMEAGKRPLFDALLKDLKQGKIDGIIAWHPDRLARNSIESGKIIDMLDQHQIKDLRFHSHQFSNDPNGKMLLGMLFVFAKHYSDDLGFKVRRGVRKRFSEGMSGGTPKHGYIQHGGRYEPDHHGNDNFKLIRTAWEMRLQDKQYPEISEFLLKNDYEKHYHPEDKEKGGRVDEWRKLTMDDSTLSRMFRDPFYCGILVQAEQETDLTDPELGLDFEPVITREEFAQVQALVPDGKRGKDKKKQFFLPCRNFVYCDVCHDSRPMSVYATGRKKNGGGGYVYFRCRNSHCQRLKREIRGHVIIDEVAEIIPQILERLSGDAYKTYMKETAESSKTIKKALRSENIRLRARVEGLKKCNEDLSKQVGNLTNQRMINEKNNQIGLNYNEIDRIEDKIKKNEDKLNRGKGSVKPWTPQEFEKMLAHTSKVYEKASEVRKDRIIRQFFSNFYFGEEKIVAFSVKEPFATLLGVKIDDIILLGGGWEIRTPAPGLPRLTI